MTKIKEKYGFDNCGTIDTKNEYSTIYRSIKETPCSIDGYIQKNGCMALLTLISYGQGNFNHGNNFVNDLFVQFSKEDFKNTCNIEKMKFFLVNQYEIFHKKMKLSNDTISLTSAYIGLQETIFISNGNIPGYLVKDGKFQLVTEKTENLNQVEGISSVQIVSNDKYNDIVIFTENILRTLSLDKIEGLYECTSNHYSKDKKAAILFFLRELIKTAEISEFQYAEKIALVYSKKNQLL